MRLLLISLLFVVINNNVFAECHCNVSDNVEFSWNNSAAIFNGKVVDIIPTDIYGYVAKIVSKKEWKNNSRNRSDIWYIYTSSGDDGCGVDLLKGESYLFDVTEFKENLFFATRCGISTVLSDADKNIKVLTLLQEEWENFQ